MDKNQLIKTMRAEGAGAGPYWANVATAAMVGNEKAKKKVAEVLGHPIRNQGDIYAVMSAAFAVMTPGEESKEVNMAARMLNAGADPARCADMYLANKLADLRRAAGLSQSQLAQKSGVTLNALQKLEHCEARLIKAQVSTVLKLAGALGITAEEFIDVDLA